MLRLLGRVLFHPVLLNGPNISNALRVGRRSVSTFLIVYKRAPFQNLNSCSVLLAAGGPGVNCVVGKGRVSVRGQYIHIRRMSGIRQNFNEECESAINKQINIELYASYVYTSMAFYFDRDDVALPGFHEYFKKQSHEERSHAEQFMKYMNERGGSIILDGIAKPERDDWDSPLSAMEAALEMEKTINTALLDLQKLATAHEDAHLCDFVESDFLTHQVKSIKEVAGHVTNLKRVGDGLGFYIYDRDLKS